MNAYIDRVDSPAGPLDFAVDDAGALLRAQFVEGEYGHSLVDDLESGGFQVREDPRRTAGVREQLIEYGSGSRRQFDMPLALSGTAWQIAVWNELMRIPYGETRTYGQIAAAMGRPGAARAVGRANATNRIPLVIPCHRVIGTNGSLTGFAGGVHLKNRLLAHENQALARAS